MAGSPPTVKPRKRSPLGHTLPALRRRMTLDTPATTDLWRRYLATGDAAAYHALVEHYAPLAFINAYLLKNRRPDFYAVEDLDTLVSDGLLGLIRAIQNGERHAGPHFRYYASYTIRSTIRREVKTRTWPGKTRFERIELVSRLRAELVQEHGRNPTRRELHARLAQHVTNPNLQIGDVDPAHFEAINGDARAVVDRRAPDPSNRAIDAETIRFAMKGLKGDDRRIFRMVVLNGKNAGDVQRAMGLGISCARDRINGVLWECRARADLARSLGVEAAAKPKRPPELRSRDWRVPAVSTLGPARKIG